MIRREAGCAAARLLPPYARQHDDLVTMHAGPLPLTGHAHPDSRPRDFSRRALGADLRRRLAHADDRAHRPEALEGGLRVGFADRLRTAGVRLRTGTPRAHADVRAAARAEAPQRTVHAGRTGAVLRRARATQSLPRVAAPPDGGGRRGVGGGALDGDRFRA